MEVINNIVILGVVVILPIFPAVIIFKFLPPGRVIATGPFNTDFRRALTVI